MASNEQVSEIVEPFVEDFGPLLAWSIIIFLLVAVTLPLLFCAEHFCLNDMEKVVPDQGEVYKGNFEDDQDAGDKDEESTASEQSEMSVVQPKRDLLPMIKASAVYLEMEADAKQFASSTCTCDAEEDDERAEFDNDEKSLSTVKEVDEKSLAKSIGDDGSVRSKASTIRSHIEGDTASVVAAPCPCQGRLEFAHLCICGNTDCCKGDENEKESESKGAQTEGLGPKNKCKAPKCSCDAKNDFSKTCICAGKSKSKVKVKKEDSMVQTVKSEPVVVASTPHAEASTQNIETEATPTPDEAGGCCSGPVEFWQIDFDDPCACKEEWLQRRLKNLTWGQIISYAQADGGGENEQNDQNTNPNPNESEPEEDGN